jgi:hypothetical protein
MSDRELCERYKMALQAIISASHSTNSTSLLADIAKTALTEK